LKKSYVKLRDFKKVYIGKFKRKVKKNRLNARRKKTIQRQQKLEEIYDIYKNLDFEEQIIEAVSTAFTIGNLNQIELQTSFYEPAEHTMMPFSDDSSEE
jgi:late competence protein required for DNA uptake (superfamily II DNA/RNA helicase)